MTKKTRWVFNLLIYVKTGRHHIYAPNYKLDKQAIGGGHHTPPTKGFFTGTKVYELDVKGQYPSIVINDNFSFDTLNCTCCRENENA
jgi:DNA polymerase, archaea type